VTTLLDDPPAADSVSARAGLRNVGGLFSPYYLFDLMQRRHADELDDAARDALRRELRSAYRSIDRRLREETSAADAADLWYRPLLELLGFGVRLATPALHSHATSRLGWLQPDLIATDENDVPRAYVRIASYGADLDAPVPLPEDPGRDTVSPSRVLEILLDAQDKVAWGLVTNGRELRLVRRGGQVAGQAIVADLAALIDADRDEEWTAFAALFRAGALVPGSDGRAFVDVIAEESERNANRIADDLRESVVEAIERLVQGVIESPANTHLWHDGGPRNGDARRLFEEALIYLYRVLFIAFAEARGLLPVTSPVYREGYSFESLRDLADRPLPRGAEDGQYFITTLRTLWTMCRGGHPRPGATAPFTVQPFGGLLFAPTRTAWLDAAAIPDGAMREVVHLLSVERPPRGRRSAPPRRFSYADLGVDQLGSIYEGLLAYEPEITERPRVEAKLVDARSGKTRGDVLLVDQARVRASDRLEQVSAVVFPAGTFLLRAAGSRRKSTGSYYTPEVVAEAFVERLCRPLTEPIIARCGERDAGGRPAGSPDEILDLKVCDPAMGSGAFLIQVVRQLAAAYCSARVAAGLDDDGRVSADELSEAKRLVATHCIYGVDLNPLAVDLARVSIWLETLAVGEPLSFLDDRLLWGDALLGAPVGLPGGALPDRIHTDAYAATWKPKSAATAEAKAAAKVSAQVNKAAMKAAKTKGLSMLGGESDVLEVLAAFREAREDIAEGMALDPGLRPVEREAQKAELFDRARADARLAAIRRMADLTCAAWFWPEDDVPPPTTDDLLRLGHAWIRGEPTPGDLRPLEVTAGAVAAERRFLHWGIELPEVFERRNPGFDLIVGNPPWEKIGSKPQELLAPLDPELLAMSGPSLRTAITRLRSADSVADRWWRDDERYQRQMAHLVKKADLYEWLRTGQQNTYRLFLERGFRIVRQDGRLGQILPAGVYRLEGAAAAREALLEQGRWEMLLAVQNERKIFPIKDYLVVAFCEWWKAPPDNKIPSLFLIGKDDRGEWRCPDAHGLAIALREFDRLALPIELETVRRLAPKTLSPPEFRDERDVTLFERITDFPPLGDPDSGWAPDFGREIDSTGDADLFRDRAWLESQGAEHRDHDEWELAGRRVVPVIGGRHIAQFQYAFSPIDRWCLLDEANERIKVGETAGIRSHERFRVAFRDIAQTSDMRTMRAALVPSHHICRNKAPYVRAGSLSDTRMILLAGLLNSLTFDYAKRTLGLGGNQFTPLRQMRVPRPDALRECCGLIVDATRPAWLAEEVSEAAGVVSDGVEWWRARAAIDAVVADAFGFSVADTLFVLSRFPLLDTTRNGSLYDALPGEHRSTITRDIVLLACSERRGETDVDLIELALEAGVDVGAVTEPSVRARVEAALELGAIPFVEVPATGSYVEWAGDEEGVDADDD
jgi:hypothetical protein